MLERHSGFWAPNRGRKQEDGGRGRERQGKRAESLEPDVTIYERLRLRSWTRASEPWLEGNKLLNKSNKICEAWA